MLIRNCTIFDGSDETLRNGQHVRIEGDEIREISAKPFTAVGAQSIDAAGRVVMPGLIDAHFHAYATECRRAGVKLGFGTDLLGPMHAWQSREFGLRAQVEKPIDVLRSATSINAEILQQTGRLGTIAPGAKADLLIVDGNPLENVQLLESPEQTIPVILKDGRVVKNAL